MSAVRYRRRKPAGKTRSFFADQRGAIAFETLFVWGFLMISVLLPLADIAIAGFQYISANQALRAFGQYIQYSPPPDITSTSGWASSAMTKANTADPRFPISNLKVYCGEANAVCVAATVTSPVKYYSFSTTVTLSPILLTAVLCSGGCTRTLSYSERFQ